MLGAIIEAVASAFLIVYLVLFALGVGVLAGLAGLLYLLRKFKA